MAASALLLFSAARAYQPWTAARCPLLSRLLGQFEADAADGFEMSRGLTQLSAEQGHRGLRVVRCSSAASEHLAYDLALFDHFFLALQKKDEKLELFASGSPLANQSHAAHVDFARCDIDDDRTTGERSSMLGRRAYEARNATQQLGEVVGAPDEVIGTRGEKRRGLGAGRRDANDRTFESLLQPYEHSRNVVFVVRTRDDREPW